MKILFDQGTPAPLRRELPKHSIATAFEKGWATLTNGDLLITTDQNLQYQQNLAGRRIAILVLPTTSWPKIQSHTTEIAAAVDPIKPGGYLALVW